MTSNQEIPLEGISERGSARVSARAPWQTAEGAERRTNKFVLPRRRRADDLSRRERATRPERGISGCSPNPRGYSKIKDAAEAFNFDFRGKTVLDIGSSTGGFTKYALDHGAKQVIAVEKGTNQMMAPLRHNPHVELHEKTDIFNVSISEEGDGPGGGPPLSVSEVGEEKVRQDPRWKTVLNCVPDAIVADVSFISLAKVLAHARANLADHHTDFLVMLKPQFEATPSRLNNGIIKNDKIRREIIKNFELWLKQNNFVVIAKHDNQLKGKTGNQERFYYLKLAK